MIGQQDIEALDTKDVRSCLQNKYINPAGLANHFQKNSPSWHHQVRYPRLDAKRTNVQFCSAKDFPPTAVQLLSTVCLRNQPYGLIYWFKAPAAFVATTIPALSRMLRLQKSHIWKHDDAHTAITPRNSVQEPTILSHTKSLISKSSPFPPMEAFPGIKNIETPLPSTIEECHLAITEQRQHLLWCGEMMFKQGHVIFRISRSKALGSVAREDL